MAEFILNVPPKAEYKKSSKKMFFSYPEDQRQFQLGYYGVTPNVSIVGSLHLRFPTSDPISAHKIELVFKGYEKVRWTEHHGKTTIVYSAENVFVHQVYQLWSTSNSSGYEEILNMDLPFEFKLPESLPPSIDIDKCRGKIRYKLIANIERKRKGNLWEFKRKEKSIILSINLNTYVPPPMNLLPFNWNQLNDSEALSRGLGYDVTLENSIGSPNIPFVINILLKFYKQDFKITKIFFGVKEYHKLITKRHSRKHTFYLTETNIKGEDIQLDSNGEISSQIKLAIPERDNHNNNNTCWTLHGREHMIVSHKVKIKLHCGGIFTDNIKLEREVQIKNILLDNQNHNELNNGIQSSIDEKRGF